MFYPIFSESFLQSHLYNFKLSTIPNIRPIKRMIENFILELESGKIDSLKEEEIKSRFVNTFFGDVLGYNYGNSNNWLLREEKKSKINGTKPDAVLGYFFKNKEEDDVRVVIEIKDAKTNLDLPQKRVKNFTPVEQAFNYGSQTGGHCKWIVVSNINEIRFYPYSDRSKCQIFHLKDLNNENTLKEFLFLFHKDRLIKHKLTEKSNTDKLFDLTALFQEKENNDIHIIDKIYYSLKRFEDFGFVSPDYIASIEPFNVLNEYVWHYYDHKLFTLNSEIYNLLNEIEIKKNSINFSKILENEIKTNNIFDAQNKIEWSFKFLNKCLITEIEAIRDFTLEVERSKNVLGFSKKHIFNTREDNSLILDIDLSRNSESCDCVICNYRNFRFDKLVSKLKSAEGNPNFINAEYAFGNFLVSSNDYKTSYIILKSLQNEVKHQSNKGVKYFLTTLNITLLYNLIQFYSLEDKEEIRNEIRNIDLDKILYDELEFYVEKDVLNYLKKIKEDDLIYRIRDEIHENIEKIQELKKLIDNGGEMHSGPNYSYNLLKNYHELSLNLYGNYIFYFKFSILKKITEKFFEGLLISYNTCKHGLVYFEEFALTEAILNIPQSKLKKILEDEKIIKTGPDTVEELLEKLHNLLTSYFNKGFFNDPIENSLIASQLENFGFRELFTSVFANLFIVLVKVEINKTQFRKIVKPLIDFLSIEKVLAHYDLKELEYFILEKGDLFEQDELEEILILAIKRDRSNFVKYEGLLRNLPIALKKYFPNYEINKKNLIRKAILNCHSDNNFVNYRKIIKLVNISDIDCKNLLIQAFEEFLDEKFDYDFYESLLRNSVIDISHKNYFYQYTLQINNYKGKNTYSFGKLKLTDLVFINYIILIYKLNVDFEKEELKLFDRLNSFEEWILNPKKFDYKNFDIKWLLEIEKYYYILDRLSDISAIKNKVNIALSEEYNPILADIKYRYFNK